MREIKFRAWYKEGKEMFLPPNIMLFEGLYNGIDWGEGINSMVGPAKYILMQFTGLKDENGKEIYEGDILRLLETVPSDDPAYPYYCDTMEVCYCEPHCRFGLTDGGAILDIPSNVEVIGNIYENPDLC